MFGSKELAYAITMHDYELFMAISQVFSLQSFFLLHLTGVWSLAWVALSSIRQVQVRQDYSELRHIYETI